MARKSARRPEKADPALRTWLVLIGAAQNRQTVQSRTLVERAALKSDRAVGRALERIELFCRTHGLPPLGALAVDHAAGRRDAGSDPLADHEAVFAHDWYAIGPPTDDVVDEAAAAAPHAAAKTASPRRRRDAAHQTRSSDHNPWVRDGGIGVVTAMDVTHDPAGGCEAGRLAEAIRASRDRRVKYVIFNRRIANSAPINGAAPWEWRPYGGTNAHTKHVHISVKPEKAAYESIAPWGA